MRLGFYLFLFSFTGCAMKAHLPTVQEDASKLHRLVEEFYEEYLQLFPIEATYIGDHRFDDRLGNPASVEHHQKVQALYQRYLQRAQAFNPSTLPEESRLTLEVFVWECEQALALHAFPVRLLPLNQMDSLASTLAQLGSGEGAQPLETVEQHEKWLRRASQFPAWVDSTIEALREGQKQNITYPQVAMEDVVGQLDVLAKFKEDESLFFAPLKKLPGPEQANLLPQYREVFLKHVLPAYARLRDFLQQEHLPLCRKSVGWSDLPQGRLWYDRFVERMTTTKMTAEDIHLQGLKEVARIRKDMEAVMREVGFKGPLTEFFAYVRDDARFYFQTSSQLLAGYRNLKTKIDAALPHLFSDFPKAPYEVREVEAYRARSAAGAEYQAPSADGSRPGIFYVNTFNLKAQPIYGMETLSLHEAAPGHHFQIAIQQELTQLPRFRRFGGYVAYAEGWALYAESLGKALGLFTDPMQYYGRLNDEQLRAMRLVVDTGLHAMGWSRQQAIDYMLANSSLAPSDVEAEVERYMVWPGQALGYKVGQLKLTALRRAAEEKLGSSFDVKAWHSMVLRGGSMPLSVLEAHLARLTASP